MNGLGCFDRDGKPISFWLWAHLFDHDDYRKVERTYVGKSCVSTVWIGLDSAFGFADAPLIFESLIERPDGEAATMRYATRDEAQRGHLAAVTLLRATQPDDYVLSESDVR